MPFKLNFSPRNDFSALFTNSAIPEIVICSQKSTPKSVHDEKSALRRDTNSAIAENVNHDPKSHSKTFFAPQNLFQTLKTSFKPQISFQASKILSQRSKIAFNAKKSLSSQKISFQSKKFLLQAAQSNFCVYIPINF